MTDRSFESPADLDALAYQLDNYTGLLRSFREAGYEFSLFDADSEMEEGELLIRHDVDLSIDRALAMAEAERELGVQSTFCFLVGTPVYDLTRPRNIRTVRRISKLGHDIALHFDTHTHWNDADEPAPEALAAKVTDELDVLGRLIGEAISTASFHVPPDWVLNRSFEGFTNTYAPPFFDRIAYRSDSSQKWQAAPPFPEGVPRAFQLLVHPGLWYDDHRPMGDIVADLRRRSHRAVDDYFDPLS